MRPAYSSSAATRQLVGVLLFATLSPITPGIARAIDIIPSFGVTKSTDADAGDAKAFGGLAVRAGLLGILKAEVGIAFRQDSFADGDVAVRQWPVTASLWASPFPLLYAGGGVG